MSKVSTETLIDVNIEDIQAQVNKIAFLLSGKIDYDNIYESGTVKSKIQSKIVSNLAEETNPVDGFKFFGDIGDQNFKEDILEKLLEVKDNLIQPIILKGSCAFVFNSSTMEREEEFAGEEDLNFLEQVGRAFGQFKDKVSEVSGDDILDTAGDFLQTATNPNKWF